MKILGIIPARGGSKGIPKKNIKLIKGKPLIAYTIEEALKSKLDEVIVSTDCKEIANVSHKYTSKVIIRPKKLAQDDSPTIEAIKHALMTVEGDFDSVMILQPTSPLRTYQHINEAIELFKNDKDADSLVSVVEVPHNYMPEKLMEFDGKYLQGNLQIKRRQEIKKMYARNGAAIYISKVELIKNDKILGDKILPYFMDKISSFDIDDMEAWFICESILMKMVI